LIKLINRKTGETIEDYPRFIKQDQVAIARFELAQSQQAICMELFKDFPQLGRFTLQDKDQIIAVGKVLQIIN
jgi:peptide chain release factor subunit 3